ncbi:MAG TPA: type II toxin-antitoxin system VapC family toxin [Ignavibacteria bacterium]|nr:type II toxin-antitoxin system VapC family toxin [Ignavibacteria bacterium]
MKTYVLDSYALIAYLEGEPSGEKVTSLLEDAIDNKSKLLMSVINWGEIYYIALREGGNERAELYLETVKDLPLEVIEADRDITLEAAKFKASNKMSFADAFAASLALNQEATLVTGDKEFKPLEETIKILWL